MLEFEDPIPDVSHQLCRALIAQEYWYRGKLVSNANVLYLRLEANVWHRFLIDAGVVFWKTVSEPEVPQGDADCRYLHKDIGEIHGLVGKRVSGIIATDLPGGGELRLAFDSGDALVLRNVDDTSTLTIERAKS